MYNSLGVDIYIYRYMISLDFRNKSPAGFHKQAGDHYK